MKEASKQTVRGVAGYTQPETLLWSKGTINTGPGHKDKGAKLHAGCYTERQQIARSASSGFGYIKNEATFFFFP